MTDNPNTKVARWRLALREYDDAYKRNPSVWDEEPEVYAAFLLLAPDVLRALVDVARAAEEYIGACDHGSSDAQWKWRGELVEALKALGEP